MLLKKILSGRQNRRIEHNHNTNLNRAAPLEMGRLESNFKQELLILDRQPNLKSVQHQSCASRASALAVRQFCQPPETLGLCSALTFKRHIYMFMKLS